MTCHCRRDADYTWKINVLIRHFQFLKSRCEVGKIRQDSQTRQRKRKGEMLFPNNTFRLKIFLIITLRNSSVPILCIFQCTSVVCSPSVLFSQCFGSKIRRLHLEESQGNHQEGQCLMETGTSIKDCQGRSYG